MDTLLAPFSSNISENIKNNTDYTPLQCRSVHVPNPDGRPSDFDLMPREGKLNYVQEADDPM